MPGSDGSGCPRLDDLIGDIGRSEARGSGPATAERHLMELAGDPLMVGAFLAREDGGVSPPPKPRAPVPGEVTIALARSILAEGSLDQRGATARLRQYENAEPRHRTSLSPSAFAPSRSDRDCALDHAASPPGDDPENRLLSQATPIIAIVGVSLIMLLLGLRVVPD